MIPVQGQLKPNLPHVAPQRVDPLSIFFESDFGFTHAVLLLHHLQHSNTEGGGCWLFSLTQPRSPLSLLYLLSLLSLLSLFSTAVNAASLLHYLTLSTRAVRPQPAPQPYCCAERQTQHSPVAAAAATAMAPTSLSLLFFSQLMSLVAGHCSSSFSKGI